MWTTTRSPTTSGDIEVWNSGTTPVPGNCQSCSPVAASKAVTDPVIPWAKRRPLSNVGVDFGPARCRAVDGFMSNGAA